MQNYREMLINLLLVALSSLLVTLPWYGISSLPLLVAFVPLLMLQERTKGRRFVPYAFLFLLIWNVASIWWVAKAAMIGVVAGTLVTSILFATVFAIYNYTWKRSPRALAYTILVAGWVGAEYIYINGEISFPWLVLGNGMAIDTWAIQWYEWSGALGGSLWILVSNLLIFNLIQQKKECGKYSVTTLVWSVLWIVGAMVLSLVIYLGYDPQEQKRINVAVLQPNIDPYNEKFGGLTQQQQLDILLEESASSPRETDLFVAPETSLDGTYWQHLLDMNGSIKQIEELLTKSYPASEFITGITTLQYYEGENNRATTTARKGNGYYYDIYNSSIMIDSSGVQGIYHKSKLVIGVEMLPFHEYLDIINIFSVDLGGISGMLGTQKERINYKTQKGVIGSAICYESIYGEYFTQFVRNGAQAMCVITNDGWWDNTPGYMQHLSYSRLRAIECRRSIARSANTGVSAFINSRGDITSSLGWDERGVLYSELPLSDDITFYVSFGDVAGRVACYTFILSLLYFIAYRRKKKDHLYQ